MDTQTVITLGKDAIVVVLTLSAPLMAVGLLVGLVIGIFQTVTSVQESTLAYIPKMVAVFLAFLICLPNRPIIAIAPMATIAITMMYSVIPWPLRPRNFLNIKDLLLQRSCRPDDDLALLYNRSRSDRNRSTGGW